MSEAILVLSITFGLLLGTFVFATHVTLCGTFKYYKPTYELLVDLHHGHYINVFCNQISIKLSTHDEIIFFEDGAIKLCRNEYIHNTFYMYFSPYTLYYRYKLNKLKPRLIALYQIEQQQLNVHIESVQLTKSYELNFKFFRG